MRRFLVQRCSTVLGRGSVRLCVQRACLGTQTPYPDVPTRQREDGGITVGDVDLDAKTVDHFLQSVGATSEEDVNEFRRLADNHLSNVDFDAVDQRKFNPDKDKNISDLKEDLVKHVAEVTDDTVSEMVDELIQLYQEQRTELAPSSNPSYAEFPVRDIASESIEDPDLVDVVVKTFYKRLAELKSKSKSPALSALSSGDGSDQASAAVADQQEMKSKSQSPALSSGDGSDKDTAAVVDQVQEMKSKSPVVSSGDITDKATAAEVAQPKPAANT